MAVLSRYTLHISSLISSKDGDNFAEVLFSSDGLTPDVHCEGIKVAANVDRSSCEVPK